MSEQKFFVNCRAIEATPMAYSEFLGHFDVEDEGMDAETPGYLIDCGGGQYQWAVAEDFESDHVEIGDLEGLEPYQQRLMVERTILAINYEKLERSFAKTTFLALPYKDRELLQAQARAMKQYLTVLNKRITAFLH